MIFELIWTMRYNDEIDCQIDADALLKYYRASHLQSQMQMIDYIKIKVALIEVLERNRVWDLAANCDGKLLAPCGDRYDVPPWFLPCAIAVCMHNPDPLLYSQSSTSATVALSGWIGGNRSDILNPANLEPVSGESPDGWLCTRSWRLRLYTTSSAEFDVDGVDSNELEFLAHVNRSEHS